ncbi:hypothetical protein GXW78_13785 [Roseomonas terrae]|jgi:hypothetical protein|uniref:Hedgehog/Intein (Hint) domain-containing protein n=1 Tax=Neoroseomonas terrae TaxID=424799 RepID=A0ABS5EI78_9PROT|nr:hypothetical protein [Neoroseomonas terrae]MBR0650743.1 hypothetical protein [Neoroseomonas terrae]
MPFLPSGLSALTTANGFTLWHYRTGDDRTSVLAPGYFSAAAARLLPGDIVIVQAADATALVPIRGGSIAGGGVTVDAAGFAPSLMRSATLLAEIFLTTTAVARAIVLDAVPALSPGDMLSAGATVTGPIAQLTFSFRRSDGSNVSAPQTVPVLAGRAVAGFLAPEPAGGYRLHAVDPADPANATLSPPFAVTHPPRLLTELGGRLLAEDGAQLVL